MRWFLFHIIFSSQRLSWVEKKRHDGVRNRCWSVGDFSKDQAQLGIYTFATRGELHRNTQFRCEIWRHCDLLISFCAGRSSAAMSPSIDVSAQRDIYIVIRPLYGDLEKHRFLSIILSCYPSHTCFRSLFWTSTGRERVFSPADYSPFPYQRCVHQTKIQPPASLIVHRRIKNWDDDIKLAQKWAINGR